MKQYKITKSQYDSDIDESDSLSELLTLRIDQKVSIDAFSINEQFIYVKLVILKEFDFSIHSEFKSFNESQIRKTKRYKFDKRSSFESFIKRMLSEHLRQF